MDATEQKFTYRGQEVRLCGVDCAACGNFFFVVGAPEFQPKQCCYCGIQFKWYVADSDDTPRNLNGLPRE